MTFPCGHEVLAVCYGGMNSRCFITAGITADIQGEKQDNVPLPPCKTYLNVGI